MQNRKYTHAYCRVENMSAVDVHHIVVMLVSKKIMI